MKGITMNQEWKIISLEDYKSERACISRDQFDTEYITCYRVSEVRKIVHEANMEIAKLNGIIEGMKIARKEADK